MPAFFVALRESVHDLEEMRLYAEKAAGSAMGHRLVTKVAYGRLRITEGAPIEGVVVLELRHSRKPKPGMTARRIRTPSCIGFMVPNTERL